MLLPRMEKTLEKKLNKGARVLPAQSGQERLARVLGLSVYHSSLPLQATVTWEREVKSCQKKNGCELPNEAKQQPALFTKCGPLLFPCSISRLLWWVGERRHLLPMDAHFHPFLLSNRYAVCAS